MFSDRLCQSPIYDAMAFFHSYKKVNKKILRSNIHKRKSWQLKILHSQIEYALINRKDALKLSVHFANGLFKLDANFQMHPLGTGGYSFSFSGG